MADAAQVAIRLLSAQRDDMAQLQRVMESAPRFTHLVTGCPAGLADAQSAFSALPEGKDYDDKFVFGVFLDRQMIGCADLIRACPDARTALLGLLLINESFQRRGIGRAAYRQLERVVVGWGTCTRIRIGVVRTNQGVLGFWHGLGFVETGEVKPYYYGRVKSETIVLHRSLTEPG